MTRLVATALALFVEIWACFGIASLAKAQTYTNPNANSRYAPPQTNAVNAANAAAPPVGPAVGPVAGPSPGAPNGAPRAASPSALGRQAGPIRTVADEQPIRQPQGIAPGVILPLGQQQPAAAKQPDWFPLPDNDQKYVDSVLAFWEQHSSKINTYKCDFQRWDYDAVFGPKDNAKTFAEGTIQYAQPDKGLFKVEKFSLYAAPAKAGEEPKFVPQEEYGEHWVCDGKQVFEFDNRKKQVIVRVLPPAMQGKAIAEGPLPFLFGAKAETIKSRYWVRAITPAGTKGEYWLEAVPKSRQDAANFKMVHIILDEADFLPKGMQVFAPNFDPKTNPSRQAYVFAKRETNKFDVLNVLNPFAKAFFNPPTPSGWKRVVENMGAPPPAVAGPDAGGPGQATRPNLGQAPR